MTPSINDVNGVNGVAATDATATDAAAGSDAELPFVDALIIGAGPAGASLACFLASHGTYSPHL
jgi:alkyl hydroperoxide reductase subunit AhpF